MDRKEILIIILVLLLAGTIGYLIYAKNRSMIDDLTPLPAPVPNPVAKTEPSQSTRPTQSPSVTNQVVPPVVNEEKITELDNKIKDLQSEDPNDQDLLVE